jgi:hypothetical protein
VTSALAAVPPARRRRLAATLGGFALLFAVIAVVAPLGVHSAAGPVFCVIAAVAALVLGAMAWGLVHSVRVSSLGAGLPAMSGCGCGHDHDWDEVGAAQPAPPTCASSGSGGECTHDCAACVLAPTGQAQPERSPSNP